MKIWLLLIISIFLCLVFITTLILIRYLLNLSIKEDKLSEAFNVVCNYILTTSKETRGSYCNVTPLKYFLELTKRDNEIERLKNILRFKIAPGTVILNEIDKNEKIIL